MPNITLSEVSELADPKLKSIAKRVLNTLCVEAEKAVAHHAEPGTYKLSADANSVEAILLARFKTLSATKQQAAATLALASVRAPLERRQALYGDIGALDLKTATTVEAQVRALPFPAALRLQADYVQTHSMVHGQILVPQPSAAPITRDGLKPQANHSKLEFRIHRVRCVDETNPEWPGDDEIALAGVSVDESGDTKKITEFMVRDDFDDGEQKVYSPPKQFTFFSLLEGTTWPKSYAVTLILAEKDMGGLSDFLTKLWEKVKGKVLEAVAAAIGGAIGSTVPGLGTLVGTVVGWVLGKFIEWLIGLFQDDIFAPITLTASIPSLGATWSGKTDSPEGEVKWTGYGGEYRLVFDWRLFN